MLQNSETEALDQKWGEINQKLSPMLINCLNSIDASFWLLGGQRFSQALMMLHNAIELALKAELESVHPLLIRFDQKINYQTLKILLSDEIKQHSNGMDVDIEKISSFENDNYTKTITFVETVKRIKEFYSKLFNTWGSKLDKLNKARNQIAHAGPKSEEKEKYIELIATSAYPFLKEFLAESQKISFDHLFHSKICRELEIATEISLKLSDEGKKISQSVFKTARQAILFSNVEWPTVPEDILGIETGSSDFAYGQVMESVIRRSWGEEKTVRIECRICEGFYAQVKLSGPKSSKKKLIPVEVDCPHCNLRIFEHETYLAECHVGAFSEYELEDLG